MPLPGLDILIFGFPELSILQAQTSVNRARGGGGESMSKGAWLDPDEKHGRGGCIFFRSFT